MGLCMAFPKAPGRSHKDPKFRFLFFKNGNSVNQPFPFPFDSQQDEGARLTNIVEYTMEYVGGSDSSVKDLTREWDQHISSSNKQVPMPFCGFPSFSITAPFDLLTA